MSNSKFNFRTALNEVKETKQSQNSIKVDTFLRKVIAEIDGKDVEISKEMLDEILFVQYSSGYYYNGTNHECGAVVMIYIRKLNNPNDKTEDVLNLNLYLKIMEYAFSSREEASIVLKMAQEKLKAEGFDIKRCNARGALANGQSFILRDCLR